MIVHYGYNDASGDFFIILDTDRCNGCGGCVSVCPESIFEVVGEDKNDPFREGPVMMVKREKAKKLKYECVECKTKPGSGLPPCMRACEPRAILHSW
jgi:ferredoxin